ncbi:MAG: hypothetical protein HOK71_12640 [Planctomycetaceae bacterium]|jgi:hypothetical protein|nr:hypothetical protein [Planctomycetaceae bacterium]MBT6485492.1 hypothetical protein [Planctomycetaceae bacterium]
MNKHEQSKNETPAEAGREETAQTAADSTNSIAPDRRLKRIQDYLNDALGKVDTREAVIGAANSDLMLIGYRLKRAIEEALSTESHSLEQFQALMPAVQTYLKITTQVGRLAQLEHRLSTDQTVAKRRLAAFSKGEESAI